MSDLGWNGYVVQSGANNWDQAQQHIKAYVDRVRYNQGGKLYSGEILSTDELTISVVKQFGEQDEMMGDFHELLAALVGIQGDDVIDVNALQNSTEDGAGQLGGAWNGGKH